MRGRAAVLALAVFVALFGAIDASTGHLRKLTSTQPAAQPLTPAASVSSKAASVASVASAAAPASSAVLQSGGSVSVASRSGSGSGSGSGSVTGSAVSGSSQITSEMSEGSSEASENSEESSSLGEESSAESSSSSSSSSCKIPSTCRYPINQIEKIDPELKGIIPPPGKDEKVEEPGKQGTMKASLVETEVEELIPATPVVPDDTPSLVETEAGSEIIADTKEPSNNVVPSLDTHFQLKTKSANEDYDMGFDKKYGLAPTMSHSTIIIKRAERVLPVADKRHYEFEERHAMDCAGSICPKESPVAV